MADTTRHVLRGARVVDGSGSPSRAADIEIDEGIITAVEEPGSVVGATVVDLDGLVLAPGFVDVHTHFDAQVFWDPDFTPSCWHGVTTAIQGNCGFGIAPTRPHERSEIMETLENVEGMNLQTLTEGIDWRFESFREYLDAVRAQPLRINLGTYIGHTPVRAYVMGATEACRRAATPEEVAQMEAIVADAMDAGAAGFSTSLAPSHTGFRGLPVPSRLAEPDELRALCSAVARSGRGIVELTYGPPLDIAEAARWAEELGVRISWGALLTGLFGEPGAALELLEQARSISDDIWPQVSCREIVFLMAMSDPYYFGTAPAFAEVLSVPRAGRAAVYADPAWRDRARPQVLEYRPGAYRRASVAETERHRDIVGVPLEDVAAARGVDPFDLWLDLALAEDLDTRFRIVSRNDDPVELGALVADERCVLGAHDAGAHVDMLCDANFPTHLLSHWVRDQQALSLEQAVWRLSGQPAELWRLTGRGRIAVGNHADLVAFDADTVASGPVQRRYDFPAGGDRLVAESIGVHHVWVNGRPIRRDGQDVPGAAPGVLVP